MADARGTPDVAELTAAWKDRWSHLPRDADDGVTGMFSGALVDGDALCEALARVEAARQQEQRRREAVERMMTLCSDHRDKQREEPCLACQRDEARRLAEKWRATACHTTPDDTFSNDVKFPWEAS